MTKAEKSKKNSFMITLIPFISLEDSVSYLKSKCKENGKLHYDFNNYYCGITNDVARRESEHKTSFLGSIECKDFETAKKLEAKMKDEGFDTGKQLGNGQEDSKFVYVYKKINGVTNESL